MIYNVLLVLLLGISTTFFTDNVHARLSGEGIIGGDNAKEGQFPYQVSLEANGISFCGGSILSERFILTAAHCTMDEEGKFFGVSTKVVAGINDLTSRPEHRVVVDVVKVFVPQEYNPANKTMRVRGDIAILKLNKALGIKKNNKLGRVKLPSQNEDFEGVEATATGFGYNSIQVVFNTKTGEGEEINGKRTKKLRYAMAKVISSEDCLQYYSNITEKHLCAHLVQRNKDEPEGLCSGDSGGPLVYDGIQIAIVSFSPLGCREDSHPAIYTRLSSYIDFLKKVAGNKTDDSIRTTTLEVNS